MGLNIVGAWQVVGRYGTQEADRGVIFLGRAVRKKKNAWEGGRRDVTVGGPKWRWVKG